MSEGTKEMPAPETVPDDGWQRVNKLSMLVQLVRLAFQAILPASFLLYSSASDARVLSTTGPILLAVGTAIVATVGLSTWLNWVRLRYRIGDSDVKVEKGLVSRQARSVPYDRIQDVSLEQKLVPRLLGLVQVKFETGAGGKDELTLAYVSEAEGERLREVVRALVDGEPLPETVPQEADDAPPAASTPPARTLFAMGPKRLFTYGLFNFSLVIFAVLLGAAQQFEFLLPFDLWDYVSSFFSNDTVTDAGTYISSLDMFARLAAILYAIGALVVLGLGTGVVRTFIRDWEFLLERTAKGFRRRRGLLTKTDVVMPVHRVQALVVKTGWLRRRFGWHGLSFISLAQDSGRANHDVAPFARMAEIAPIAAEAGFTLPGEGAEWRRASPRYYTDKAVIFAGILGLAATGNIVFGNAWIGLAIGLLAAIMALREFFLWHFDRHALDPAQVLSRRGWLAPRLQIASRAKLHSVEIAQGPLARWRGYCDLRFGMAGGRFSFDGLALADARKLRAAVLESISAVDFAKLPR